MFPLVREGLIKSVTTIRADRDCSVRVQFNAWMVRKIMRHISRIELKDTAM